MDLTAALAENPLRPALWPPAAPAPAPLAPAMDWVEGRRGPVEIGDSGPGFAFDLGEGPRHQAIPNRTRGAPATYRQEETGHHDRHQDLDQVGQEGPQRADCHLPRLDPVSTEPEHGHAEYVQDQHHDREDRGDQSADRRRRGREARRWPRRSASLVLGSRTNARTTRMPVICSRSTRFTRVDARLHQSEQRTHLADDQRDRDGQHRGRPPRPARTGRCPPAAPRSMLPIMVMGAMSPSRHDNSTSIWTCCTSLVFRVIRVGAPNRLSSRAENVSTRSKMAPRTSPL